MSEFLVKIDEIENLCKLLHTLNQEIENLKSEILRNSYGLTWEAREFRKRQEELDEITTQFTTIYTLLNDKIERIILFRASLEKIDAEDWEALLTAKGYDANKANSVMSADVIMDVIKSYEPVEGKDENGNKTYTLKDLGNFSNRDDEIEKWIEKLRLNAGDYDLAEGLAKACGDPINASTGNFITRKSDIIIEGFKPIEFTRFYNSIDSWNGTFGKGWHHSYEIVLEVKRDNIGVVYEDGRLEQFREEDGVYIPINKNSKNRLKKLPDGIYILTMSDRTKIMFNDKGQLEVLKDSNGNLTQLEYDENKLVKVESVCGYLEFEYKDNKLIKLKDHAGRIVEYEYIKENISKVKDSEGFSAYYKYNDDNKLETLMNTYKNILVKNEYDSLGRVVNQETADGSRMHYRYIGKEKETEFTERNGVIVRYKYDSKKRVVGLNFLNTSEPISFEDNGYVKDKTNVNENNKGKFAANISDEIQKISELDVNKSEILGDGDKLKEILNGSISIEKRKYNELDKLIDFIDSENNSYKYEYDENGNKTKSIDAVGNDILYFYDENSNITQFVKYGREYNFVYDNKSNVIKFVDPLNRETNIFYNDKGLKTKIVFPDESTEEFEYDSRGNLIKEIDSMERITLYKYDNLNRVIESIDPRNNTTEYLYTANGNIKKVNYPDGTSCEFKYDYRNEVIEEVDQNNDKIIYNYDKMNHLTSVIDKFGRETKHFYDNLGNHIKTIYPDETAKKYVFDKYSNLISEIDKEDNEKNYKYNNLGDLTEIIDEEGFSTKLSYDGLRRLTCITKPDGSFKKYEYENGKIKKITEKFLSRVFSYDDVGNIIKIVDSKRNIYKYEYDLLDRCIGKEDPLGNKTKYIYDKIGNMICLEKADGSVEKYEYDEKNNLKLYINPLGYKTKYIHNEMDKLIEVINEEVNTNTVYNYCNRGNINKILFEDNSTVEFVFDKDDRCIKSVDREGNISEYIYNYDKLIEEKRPDNKSVKFEYSKNGKLIKKINPDNTEVEFSYDKKGNLVSVVDACGYKEEYKYDSLGRQIEFTNKLNNSLQFKYDELNNITEIKGPDGYQVNKAYNEYGYLTSLTDANGYETNYKYDAVNNLIKVIDTKGIEKKFVYDELSRVKYVIEEDGRTTEWEYDQDGTVRSVKLPNNLSTKFKYNPRGNIETKEFPDGSIIKYQYDKCGRLISEINQLGYKTEYEYNRNSQLIKIKYADGTFRMQKYNELGKCVSVVYENGVVKEFKYDSMGRLILEKGVNGEKEYQYSTSGFLCGEIDENGNKTAYERDPIGNILEVVKPNGAKINYTYNSFNKLSSIIKSGSILVNNNEGDYDRGIHKVELVTKLLYDKKGNLILEEYPNGLKSMYVYNHNDRVVSRTSKDGSTSKYEYNISNNLSRILSSDGKEVRFLYNSMNKLVKMTDWLGENKFEYDSMGRLIKSTDYENDTIQYMRDLLGNVEAIIYPDNDKLRYTYNSVGKILSMTSSISSVTYNYNKFGQLEEKNYGNGIKTNYSYNKNSKISSIIVKNSNDKVIDELFYSYDKVGNRNSIVKNGIETRFMYTKDNQLAGLVKGDYRETYIYDDIGNRVELQKIDEGYESTYKYFYDKNNSLRKIMGDNVEVFGKSMETVFFDYDNNGNLIAVTDNKNQKYDFIYNSRGRLEEVYENEKLLDKFNYDGFSRRVGANGEKQICDTNNALGKNLLSVKSDNNSKNFYYGVGYTPEVKADDKYIEYYGNDERESVSKTFDNEGSIISKSDYSEFGTSDSKDDFTYASYQSTSLQGLLYARERYYMSDIGRYISEDVYKGDIKDIKSLNYYTYCRNNPVTYIDPYGYADLENHYDVAIDAAKESGIYDGMSPVEIEALKAGSIYPDVMTEKGAYGYGKYSDVMEDVDPVFEKVEDVKRNAGEKVEGLIESVPGGQALMEAGEEARKSLNYPSDVFNYWWSETDFMSTAKDASKSIEKNKIIQSIPLLNKADEVLKGGRNLIAEDTEIGRSHYGDWAYIHGMAVDGLDAKKTQKDAIDEMDKHMREYQRLKNGNAEDRKEAYFNLGQAYHYMTDAYTPGHVVRDPKTGKIEMFIDYSKQSGNMHHLLDDLKGLNDGTYEKAVGKCMEMTKDAESGKPFKADKYYELSKYAKVGVPGNMKAKGIGEIAKYIHDERIKNLYKNCK